MQVTPEQEAWLSLTCQRTAGVGSVCRKPWLQPAISSSISSAVPQCIKAEKKKSAQNKVLGMAETQICRVQSPSPCDYTHTRAQKQKLVLSAVFK